MLLGTCCSGKSVQILPDVHGCVKRIRCWYTCDFCEYIGGTMYT